MRTSQRFRAGDEFKAEDEPTLRLFSFWADRTPVAFYGVATLSQSTLSHILRFIVYITSIQRSKAASPVVSKSLIVSDGHLIDRYTAGFRKARYSSMVGCYGGREAAIANPAFPILIPDSEFWILASTFWILDSRFYILNSGF